MVGQLGLIEYPFWICDDDPGDADPPEDTTITVTVQWEGIITEHTITGIVD